MRLAREQKYGTKVTLSKTFAGPLPQRFETSAMSLPNGATGVYRDQQAKNSFQVREYDNKYTVEMDKHNPEKGNPAAHAIQDAPVYTAIGLVALGALLRG